MYYYILEPSRSRSQINIENKIRDLIGNAGIGGQIVSPSPARTIDELIGMGAQKEYTTVVSIGSDAFINRTYGAFAKAQSLRVDNEQVFGIIPLDLGGHLAKLFDIPSYEIAVDTLRFRKLVRINTIVLEPKKYFISPIVLKWKDREAFGIESADWQIVGHFKSIEISPWGEIKIQDEPKKVGFSKYITSFFSAPSIHPHMESVFQSTSFRLLTKDSVPVYLEDEIWAKTPITLRNAPFPLQFIVPRASVETSPKD